MTPVVGAAIAAGGNQIVTTVMTTYAVDCYRQEAASVGVFISFVRQIWGRLSRLIQCKTHENSLINRTLE